MAEYMVFIWDDEAAWADADPRTVEATQAAHEDFITRNAGALRGSNRLHPSGTATSIRRDADGGLPSATACSPKPKRPSAATT